MPRAAYDTPTAGNPKAWPNTLGNRAANSNAVVGNLNREFYTAYSYARDLRPFGDPAGAFTLGNLADGSNPLPTVGTNGSFYPPFPARVAANPDVSTYLSYTNERAADYLAIAATNIASTMQGLGYSHQEACSFAANYLTYRWNGWTATANGYSLPEGPSFIDSLGICLRAQSPGTFPTTFNVYNHNYTGGTADLTAEAATKVYLGYAAQPFVNEVAVTWTTSPDPMAATGFSKAVSDFAVELYNPYEFALDLSDYKLRVNGTDIDLAALATAKYVPAHGYFVLAADTATDHLFGKISAGTAQAAVTKDQSATLAPNTAGGAVVLLRKYRDRAGNLVYGAIDSFDYTPMTVAPASTPAASAGDEDWYQRRSNEADTTLNYWLQTVHGVNAVVAHLDTATAPELMTLGGANPADTGATALPLYDRYVGLTTQPAQRSLLANIRDFNRIMRVSSQIDSASGDPIIADPTKDFGVLSAQLAAILAAPAAQVANTQFPADATIHFDFRSGPSLYSNSDPITGAPTDPVAPPADPKNGDLRAVRLLECLAFTDRVSTYGIDLGDNADINRRGLSKLRIPGRLNVNTAPAEVLATIPALAATPKYVGAILAYRWRTQSDSDPRIPAAYRGGGYNFTDATKYPGYGIRSMGELEVALSADAAFSSAVTLDAREALWAAVYNMCTVRSDTFVLYAYLEAVKPNPNYTGGSGSHNNASDWYGGVVDDPRGINNVPNVRVSRRRWVALIDASNMNFSRGNALFTMPRIVAMKELPQ
jgi:hypothetical protein